MRFKFVVAALPGLFLAGMACAQAPTPVPPADPQNILNLDLSTGGRVIIQLRPDKAPASVERVKTLVRRHFYDGLTFHRVIEGFMAQGGDPKGTGEGGSDLPDLTAEFNDLPHVRGTMSMARAQEPNSANSQFFIMLQPNLALDGNYTAIGRVLSGMQYVDALEKGEPPEKPSKIVRMSIESDNLGMTPIATPIPVAAPAAAPAPLSKKELKAKKEQEEDDAKAAAKAEKTRKAEEAKKAREEAKAKKAEAAQTARNEANAKKAAAKAAAAAPPVAEPPAEPQPAETPPPPAADPGTSAAVNAIANDETIAQPQ